MQNKQRKGMPPPTPPVILTRLQKAKRKGEEEFANCQPQLQLLTQNLVHKTNWSKYFLLLLLPSIGCSLANTIKPYGNIWEVSGRERSQGTVPFLKPTKVAGLGGPPQSASVSQDYINVFSIKLQLGHTVQLVHTFFFLIRNHTCLSKTTHAGGIISKKDLL